MVPTTNSTMPAASTAAAPRRDGMPRKRRGRTIESRPMAATAIPDWATITAIMDGRSASLAVGHARDVHAPPLQAHHPFPHALDHLAVVRGHQDRGAARVHVL